MAEVGRLQVVVEAVDKLTTPMKNMGGAIDGLKGRLMLVIDPINLATRGFDMMKRVIGDVIGTAIKFEQSMTTVKAISGATANEMEKLNNLVRSDMVGGLGYNANEAADAMYYLVSAGYDANKAMSALEGTLTFAAATQGNLTDATQIVLQTLNQFELEAEDAMKVADVFAAAINESQATIDRLGSSMSLVGAISSAFGQDIETTTVLLGSLYNAGIEASRAGTGLARAMIDLASPTAKVARVLQEYGLSLDDVNPTSNDFIDILDKIKESGMIAADVADLFGKRAGPLMVKLLAGSIDKLYEFKDILIDSGGTAERVAKEQLSTLEGSLQSLRSSTESAKIGIGEFFSPFIIGMSVALTENLQDVNDELTRMSGGSTELKESMGETITNFFVEPFANLSKLLRVFPQEVIDNVGRSTLNAAEYMELLMNRTNETVDVLDEYDEKFKDHARAHVDFTDAVAKLSARQRRELEDTMDVHEEFIDDTERNAHDYTTAWERAAQAAATRRKWEIDQAKKGLDELVDANSYAATYWKDTWHESMDGVNKLVADTYDHLEDTSMSMADIPSRMSRAWGEMAAEWSDVWGTLTMTEIVDSWSQGEDVLIALLQSLRDAKEETDAQNESITIMKNLWENLSAVYPELWENFDDFVKSYTAGTHESEIATKQATIRMKAYWGDLYDAVSKAPDLWLKGGLGADAWKLAEDVCGGLSLAGACIDGHWTSMRELKDMYAEAFSASGQSLEDWVDSWVWSSTRSLAEAAKLRAVILELMGDIDEVIGGGDGGGGGAGLTPPAWYTAQRGTAIAARIAAGRTATEIIAQGYTQPEIEYVAATQGLEMPKAFQLGGVAAQSGLAYLHAGEHVTPAGDTNFHGGITIQVMGGVGNKAETVAMLEDAFREVAARSGARMKWGVG